MLTKYFIFWRDTDLSNVGGIASAEAFGTPSLILVIQPVGIASAEAFGIPFLEVTVSPSGIASAEAFGTPNVILVIRLVGISSSEAFGIPVVTVSIPLVVAGNLIVADREKYANASYDWSLIAVGDGTYALSVFSVANTNIVASPNLTVAKGEIFGVPLATQIPLALRDNGDGTVSLCVVKYGSS